AGFIADLAVPAPPDAPANRFRGVPLADRDEAVRTRLASGRIPAARRLVAVWDRAVAASAWQGPPVWLHGDLHPAICCWRRRGRSARSSTSATSPPATRRPTSRRRG